MAKLKNLDKLWAMEEGSTLTVGHNRTVTKKGEGVFSCQLHGHEIALVKIKGASPIAHFQLSDCGYPIVTTRQAMCDFAGAFGCKLNVSFAKGGFSINFLNGAGHRVEREGLDSGVLNGPYALGRYV